MKLKTLLLLILLGIVGYMAYDYLVVQLSQEALVYKRYMGAVMDNNSQRARQYVSGEQPMKAFEAHGYRVQQWNGDPRWVTYRFLSRDLSPDGNTMRMRVRQHARVDPPGVTTFWGQEERRDLHTVVLVRERSVWKVSHFEDSATQALDAAVSSRR